MMCLISNAQVPVANFTSNVVAGCGPLQVAFSDQSTGSPKFWNWDLGNGQLSNLQNPTAVYSTPGQYTVTLVARNANGTNGITKTNYITVYASPTPNLSANNTIACLPANIQFTDASTDPGGGTITQWRWDFGDGAISNLQNPSHTYSTIGFYNVSLTATSSTGCSGTIGIYRYIRVVSGVTPDFKANPDSLCRAPFSVNFANETSGPGLLTYSWDFGNSTNSTQQNPTATYNSTGTYNVTLNVQSEFGCSGTITKPVNVIGATTTFNSPDSACVSRVVNFQNTSTSTILSSRWDFGDGTTSTQTSPSKTFNTPGPYTVKLYNTYSFCSDSVEKQIQILPPPSVDFTADNVVACKGPFTVNFTDISPDAVAWSWDFGDGGTSNLKNPSHTYLNNGKFSVKLTITSAFGCTNTITKTDFIQILRPVIQITNVPDGGCIPFNFTPITNITSLDGVASYFWDFGDGGTDASSNPVHLYNDSGTYTIKLRITTNGGCVDSIVVGGAVRTGPVGTVDFIVDTTATCAFGAIKFKSLAVPSDTWTWDFGDGTITSVGVDTISHNYKDTGTFSVKLTAYNNGCPFARTKTQLIKVNPPIALFSDTILNCSQRQTVNFTNLSITDPSFGPVSYLWKFGNPGDSTSTAVNPTFTYPSLGIWNVSLTVTNGTCSNTITRQINLTSEIADFTTPKTSICKNEIITITAIGSTPANVSSYQWSINGGALFSGGQSIQTSFPTSGTYSIQLIMTDNNGCVDSKTVMNYLTVSGPVAGFNTIDTGGCKNTVVRFADLSTPAGTIREWSFDFGDGKQQVFTALPFTHQYTDTGFFNVKLTVKDNLGCTDVLLKQNQVRITSPKADFSSISKIFCANVDLQFKDSSRYNITSYNWSFGDGGTSNLKDPLHTYTGRDSVYTVKLTVTDTVGCMDSITKVNYIQIRTPKAAFDAVDTSSICPPLETKFFLKATDYESYYWDFGDGQTSTLANPKHFYNAYGTYDAKLYAAGFGGCLDSMVRTINVFNPYNTVINYSPLEACNELTVDFSVAPPANTRFNFYFSDGDIDSTQRTTFSHLYKSPSFYSPYMIIKDSLDCQVTVGGPDVIKIYGAEPFFGVDKKAFCDSGTVYFTNYTIANDTIISSVWDFDDGNTSVIKDPIHSFNTPGTYIVSLTATTARGCVKSLYDTVRIYATPEPIITSPDVVCINSPIDFLGSLVLADTAISWNWNLGNGKSSTSQNTNTTYGAVGNPTISLEATNLLGCKGSVSKTIEVAPLPTINLFSDPTIIVGTGILIPATYSSNVISYSWTPVKGLSCTNCPNPYANPQFTTKYNVAVVDSNGCTSSKDITVTVVCNDKNYFVPNTFSPNGDGMNDVFYPRGSGINRIQSLRIFNRWGDMLFEKKNFIANDPSAGWNGTVKGKAADQDVYVYVIEFICENAAIIPFRGNVALIR